MLLKGAPSDKKSVNLAENEVLAVSDHSFHNSILNAVSPQQLSTTVTQPLSSLENACCANYVVESGEKESRNTSSMDQDQDHDEDKDEEFDPSDSSDVKSTSSAPNSSECSTGNWRKSRHEKSSPRAKALKTNQFRLTKDMVSTCLFNVWSLFYVK